MSKIKRINISDFRIYEGKQEFNFEKNGSAANLIALYAPNGYGKTSFYDAIEWSFSDQIKRIGTPKTDEEVKQLDYNKEIKDKIILTNRKSYKNNKKGKIHIVTENGDVSKTVKTYSRRGTGTKNDYCGGEYNGDFDAEKLKKLPSLNILSQDQIDSFLRFTDAEKKFDQLNEFTNQIKEELFRFKKVDATFSLLSKSIDDLKKDLGKNESALGKIKVKSSDLVALNELIIKVTDQKFIEFQQEPLSKDISETEFQEFEEKLVNAKMSIKDRLELCEKKINQAKELSENFKINQETKKELDKCEGIIKSLNEKKKLFADKTSLEIIIEKDTKVLADLSKMIKEYKLLLEGTSNAKKVSSAIKEENKSLVDNKEKLTKAKSIITSLDKRINELKKYLEDQSITIKKHQEWTKERKQQLVEQDEYVKHIQIQEKELSEIETKVVPLEKEIKELITNRDLFKEIIESKRWGDFIDYASDEFIIQQKSHTTLLSERKQIIEDLQSTEKELKASGTLVENLKRIQSWGADFVTQRNESNCPLCNTPFDTFELLISQIERDKLDALDIPKIEIRLNNLQKREKELLTDLSRIELLLKEDIEKQIRKLIESIKQKDTRIEKLTKQRSNCSIEIKTANAKKIAVAKKLSEAILQLNIPEDVKEEEYAQYIQDKTDGFEKMESLYSGNIERYNSLKYSVLDVVTSCNGKNNKISDEINKLETDIKYVEYIKLLKICDLSPKESLSSDFKSQYITPKQKRASEEEEKFSANKNKLIEFKKKIKEHKSEKLEEQIDGELVEKEAQRTVLKQSFDSFTKSLESLSSDEIKTKEQLEEFIKEKGEQGKTIQHTKEDILSLESKSEIVQKQIDKKALEQEYRDIKKKLDSFIEAKDKVSSTRKKCVDYIQAGIETTFNKKVINEIYKRIEPHPSLDEIYFRAEIGDNGKPRLVITAKGGGDELNPNLFLSAGQVNVLSLSIFLAKAYEYGSKTISTIFMDDPIQNLSDINILSFIDVLRTLTQHHKKQIVISTHDEKFFRLLQNKIPEEYCSSKYIEFEAPGILKN